jgi:hypothetical protein
MTLKPRLTTQALIDRAPIRAANEDVMTRLRERAVKTLLDGTSWRTAKEVGERVDPIAANKHAFASRLLKDRRVFAIERAGVKGFPDYEFDALGNPIPEVREILKVLSEYSAFRLANWFESTSSMLGGRRPREVIAEHPERVLEAARAHASGPQHG